MSNFGEDIPEVVKFELPNGVRTRVRFEKEEGCFVNVRTFFHKFPTNYGICAMFSYQGNGVFVVNVMNDNLTEVLYDPPSEG